jgi:hypothetical protein
VKPEEPGPVKLIVGILYSDEGLLEKGLSLLSEAYGSLDFRPEMGSPIFRIFVSHERLIHPRGLSRIKVETNTMEEKLAVDLRSGRVGNLPERTANLPEASENLPEGVPRRKVNFDPGYLDYDKFVLASAKYNGQKIYLDHGIWADLTLHYEKGRFDPYPWSFPDFKAGLYDAVFLEIRGRFKEQRKAQLSV